MTSAILCTYVLFMQTLGLHPTALVRWGFCWMATGEACRQAHETHQHLIQNFFLSISAAFSAPFPGNSCPPYQQARALQHVRDGGPSIGHPGDSKRDLQALCQRSYCIAGQTKRTKQDHTNLAPHSSVSQAREGKEPSATWATRISPPGGAIFCLT